MPLTIDVLNPPDRFDVAYGSQIPLCGRQIGISENEFVHGLFFDDFPFRGHALPIKLADHRRIAWIYEAVIQIVANEIEEGTNVRITDALSVRLVALGESIQEP
mgnify:CR=1 FL=1